MISSIKGKTNLTPLEIRMVVLNELSAADYAMLKYAVRELTDYGLRAGGKAACPKCGSKDAAFLALVDDKFFRPTVGDLREWKHSRGTGSNKDIPRDKTAAV